jgi:hypothetical protein
MAQPHLLGVERQRLLHLVRQLVRGVLLRVVHKADALVRACRAEEEEGGGQEGEGVCKRGGGGGGAPETEGEGAAPLLRAPPPHLSCW